MKKITSSVISNEGFKITSPVMREVHAEIHDYAYHTRPCILFGPSGAGKEFVARYYYKVFKKYAKNKAPFLSLNCAGLTSTIAISELFGHAKGSFTGANRDKKGLFEEARNGVLFLDEIGDLPSEVQPMLLRAIDPETHEARRLGSNVNYSTGNVTVICATDRSKDSLRLALLSRLGKQVIIPGVEDRSEDVQDAVEFFAHSALRKRRDKDELINIVFGKKANKDIDTPSGEDPFVYLAQRLALRLGSKVINQSWPGNFRDIRNAIDTAIIRAKKVKGIEKFIESVQYYYNYHHRIFTPIPSNDTSNIINKFADAELPDIEKINDKVLTNLSSIFPRISRTEKLNWAIYLSDKKNKIFYRNELDSLFSSLKKRTIQDRLKKLVESGLLIRKGDRGDEYHNYSFNKDSSESNLHSSDLLSLPDINFVPAAREIEIAHVMEMISKSRGIFISGEKKSGKTTFVFSLGIMLLKTRPVFYHALGETKLTSFLSIVIDKLRQQQIENIPDFDNSDKGNMPVFAATLSGFLERLFPSSAHPILILDNTDTLKSAGERETLNVMLQYWKMFTFILVGEKLGNDLHLENGISLAEHIIKPIS